jgi:hypothetical protein
MAAPKAPVAPGRRGWAGHGRGGAHHIEAVPEFRATTVQACGLWPFVVGSGTPIAGVPLGHHLLTGETVCCDPVHWFSEAALIANPSALIIGTPGLGKSTVARRWMIGLAHRGITPIVLGDLKGEHVATIRALGGQVVQLGRGQGCLNVLDPGSGLTAAQRLTGPARLKLTADVLGRRLNVLAALIALNRRSPVADVEETTLSLCMRMLDDRFPPGHATLHELIALLEAGPDDLRSITLDRGDDERYRAIIDPLQRSLIALTDGALGESFARRTTVTLDLTAPLCVDISGIGESDERLVAATLLATWSEGFGAIAAAHALVEAGLEPRRNWFIILDELWRVLRSGGSGMVQRIDGLLRLDRHLGTGTGLITHSITDMLGVSDPVDALRAKGFVERIGIKVIGGVPPGELDALSHVIGFSDRERSMVTQWSSPASWDPRTGREAAPPGRGRFLLKVGGRPGIPVAVTLVASELAINDTNLRWDNKRPGDRSASTNQEEN